MPLLGLNDLLEQARQTVPEMTVADVHGDESGRVLIDIREQYEWEEGHIPGAMHLSRGFLEPKIGEALPEVSTPITLYCAAGVRSLLAARSLQEMGYSDVRSMAGGFAGWKRAGYPFELPEVLGASSRQRYSRHLRIPEVGPSGQLRLLRGKALIVGAGGLGSPAALYLAAAGVGTIGLIDPDIVDPSNLQRQVLHSTDRVGMRKTESGRRAINGLNPDVRVMEYPEALTSHNAQKIFADYDVILNGCDNFATRYLCNDVAVFLNKPLIDGSVLRFEGQVTTVIPKESACYRCRFPEPPPPGEVPSCDEAGVLGVLPGIIGSLQAAEAIKLLLKIGEPLTNRLLHFDGLAMTFREYELQRNHDCPVCGDSPVVLEPIDYEAFCSRAS